MTKTGTAEYLGITTGPQDSGLCEDHVVALLSNVSEPIRLKDSYQRPIRNGAKLWHSRAARGEEWRPSACSLTWGPPACLAASGSRLLPGSAPGYPSSPLLPETDRLPP